jgi:hypothetical protein
MIRMAMSTRIGIEREIADGLEELIKEIEA